MGRFSGGEEEKNGSPRAHCDFFRVFTGFILAKSKQAGAVPRYDITGLTDSRAAWTDRGEIKEGN